MASNKRLLVLPGDGIGPEVMREVTRVVGWLDKRRALAFDVTEGLIGGASIDRFGTPCTDETLAHAQAAAGIAAIAQGEAFTGAYLPGAAAIEAVSPAGALLQTGDKAAAVT